MYIVHTYNGGTSIMKKDNDAKQQQATSDKPSTTEIKPYSNKRFLAFFGAGALVVIIIGIVLAFGLFSGPSKKDYEEAHDIMVETQDKYKALSRQASGLSRISLLKTQADIDSSYSALKNAVNEYKETSTKIDNKKALRNEDVEKAYEEYKQQNEKFIKYSDEVINSFKPVAHIYVACTNANKSMNKITDKDSIKTVTAALKPCKSAIEEAKDVPDPSFKQLVAVMKTYFEGLETEFDKIADAYEKKNRLALLGVRTEMLRNQRKLTTESRKVTQDIRQRGKDAEVKGKLNALTSVLSDKITNK